MFPSLQLLVTSILEEVQHKSIVKNTSLTYDQVFPHVDNSFLLRYIVLECLTLIVQKGNFAPDVSLLLSQIEVVFQYIQDNENEI